MRTIPRGYGLRLRGCGSRLRHGCTHTITGQRAPLLCRTHQTLPPACQWDTQMCFSFYFSTTRVFVCCLSLLLCICPSLVFSRFCCSSFCLLRRALFLTPILPCDCCMCVFVVVIVSAVAAGAGHLSCLCHCRPLLLSVCSHSSTPYAFFLLSLLFDCVLERSA